MLSLVHRLAATQRQIDGKHSALRTLERFRAGVLSGNRVELDSAERQHLERGSHVVNEATFDARHRPISTNVSRFFHTPRLLAGPLDVVHHVLLPMPSSKRQVAGAALLFVVDRWNELSAFDMEGRRLLEGVDLGHTSGVAIERLLVSTVQDPPLVMTTDNTSRIRVHSLKIEAAPVAAPAPAAAENASADGLGQLGPASITVAPPRLACAFKLLPGHRSAEGRRLTAMLIAEHAGQTHFVAGDSVGGVTVFSHRGFLRGRLRVSEDAGGIRGLVKGQDNQVVFFTKHSFGSMVVNTLDMEHPACVGPASPIFHIAIDRSYSLSRVFLALESGDVVVYNTMQGQSRACDLTLKFPHVSGVPMELHTFRGYIVGLPKLSDKTRQLASSSELLFFSVAAMENGYGISPSRTVKLQASFPGSGVAKLSVLPPTAGESAPMALHFAAGRGVQLYDVRMRQAAKSKVASTEAVPEANSAASVFAKCFAVLIVAVLAPVWFYLRRRRTAKAAADAAAAEGAEAAAGDKGGKGGKATKKEARPGKAEAASDGRGRRPAAGRGRGEPEPPPRVEEVYDGSDEDEDREDQPYDRH